MKAELYACIWSEYSDGGYWDMMVSTKSVRALAEQFARTARRRPKYGERRYGRLVGVAFHYRLDATVSFKGHKVRLWGGLGGSGGFARRSYPRAKLLTVRQTAKHDPELAKRMEERRVKYALLLPFSVGIYSMRLFAVKEARVYKDYVTARRIHGLEAQPWYVLHPKK